MSPGTLRMGGVFSAQCCNVEAVPSGGRVCPFCHGIAAQVGMAEARSYSQSRHDNLGTKKAIEAVEMTRTLPLS